MFVNLEGEQGEEWLQEFKKFLRKEKCWSEVAVKTVKSAKNKFLKILSQGKSLIADAVDGMETLYEAEDTFAYRDSDFENYGANEKSQATGETPVEVYELVKDATFSQMFGGFGKDLNELCLTQAQIKNFVRKYREWLRKDGYATFFLFKSNDNFFVADVFFDDDGRLRVSVYRLGYDYVWSAESRHRVVVPQLAAAQ